MATHNELGIMGESVAQRFLREQGHQIIATNFRYAHHEIDIISIHGDLLVFSEVKTRSGRFFAFPEEAVNAQKQAAIKEVATAFLMAHPYYQKTRFDVLSVIVRRGEVKEILHVPDAFF